MRTVTIALLLAFMAGSMALPGNRREDSEEEIRISNEIIPGIIEVQDETSQEVITELPSVPATSTTTATTTITTTTTTTTSKAPALDDLPTSKSGNNRNKDEPSGNVFMRVIEAINAVVGVTLYSVFTRLKDSFGNKDN